MCGEGVGERFDLFADASGFGGSGEGEPEESGVVFLGGASEGGVWGMWTEVGDAEAEVGEDDGAHEGGDEVGVEFCGAAHGDGGVVGGFREQPAEVVECVDAEVGGAVFDEDAAVVVFPERADAVHGESDGSVEERGQCVSLEVPGDEQSAYGGGVAGLEGFGEGGFGVADPVGVGALEGLSHVVESEDVGSDDGGLGFADEADGFGEGDAPVTAGGS